MAEIQWVIEVRCVNTLLGEIKVDEKGEYACVTVPDRTFDPSEFEKLIEGLEVAGRILGENRKAYGRVPAAEQSIPLEPALGMVAELDRREGLYRARLLRSGELVSLDVPGELLAPSELERFIAEMKAIMSWVESRVGKAAAA